MRPAQSACPAGGSGASWRASCVSTYSASEEERARRRQRDEQDAARPIDLDAAKGQLERRDSADSSLGRATRPEDAAPDALVVDTTGIPLEQVVSDLVERAQRALA